MKKLLKKVSNTILEICWKIDEAIYPIKNFFAFIKRMIDYAPVLWRDRDWDHAHLLDIMSFKIGRMQKALDSGHFHDRRMKKQLATCKTLLDRMSVAEYEDTRLLKMQDKYGCFKLGVKMSSEATKEFKDILAYGRMMYTQDIELFCKIFKKHHRSWWN